MAIQAFVSRHFKDIKVHSKRPDFGDEIILGIGGNPLKYPSVTTLAAFSGATGINATYRGLLVAATKGDADKIKAASDYYENIWLPAVETLAAGVEFDSTGDASTIILSGFHATSTNPVAHVKPGKLGIDAEPGSKGSKLVAYEALGKVDAKSYATFGYKSGDATISQQGEQVEIQTTAATKIVISLSTTKKGKVDNLTSKDDMDFHNIAFNHAGIGTLSDKATVTVP